MFSVAAAEEVGVNAAVILEHLAFYCEKNRANGVHEHDGLFWTYMSVSAMTALHPYMSSSSVKTALRKLRDAGYIRVEKLSDFGYDRTNWYAVTETGESLVDGTESVPCIGEKSPMEQREIANGSAENSQSNICTIKDTIKDTVIDSEHSSEQGQRGRTRFTKPTPSEVSEYAASIGRQIDATRFCDYYESKGWMVGKSHMKDWRAAVRNWTKGSGGQRRSGVDFSQYNF